MTCLRHVTSKLRLACDLLVTCLWLPYDLSQASHKRVTSVSPKLRYLPSRLNWTCRQQRGLLAPPLLLAPLSLFTWRQPICTKLGNDGSWSLNFTSMGGVKTEPKTGFLVFLFFTCLNLHVLLISHLDWKALRRKELQRENKYLLLIPNYKDQAHWRREKTNFAPPIDSYLADLHLDTS